MVSHQLESIMLLLLHNLWRIFCEDLSHVEITSHKCFNIAYTKIENKLDKEDYPIYVIVRRLKPICIEARISNKNLFRCSQNEITLRNDDSD